MGALPVCLSAFIRCGREDRCLFPLSFGGLAQEYHVPPKDSTGREMHEVSECMPWVLQAASRPPPRPRPPPPPCQRQTFLETAGFELGLLEEGFSPAFKTGRRGCPSHIRPFQRALDSRSSTCQRQSRSGRSGGAPFGFPPHTPARARAHTHTHTHARTHAHTHTHARTGNSVISHAPEKLQNGLSPRQ